MPSRSSHRRAAPLRLKPLCALLLFALAAQAWAQRVTGEPIELRSSPTLQPAPRGDASRQLPIILRARTLSARPDVDMVAEGDAEFRRGGMVIRADSLTYRQTDDLAIARGNVHIDRDGNVYTGPELQLKVQSFEGFFSNPTYHFNSTGAGGTARRVDFLGEQRAMAIAATYTSCPADGSGGPAWLLSTDKLSLDFASNEGVAEGAVLRFYGVPILGAPRLSFPLTDERKSGWLPPSIGLDSKSGIQVAVPYYWNIAPNRDATITPQVATRRGLGVDTEFRYLEPRVSGEVKLNLLPHDQLTSSTRYALTTTHDADMANGTRLQLQVLRVSDNDYWKDFPRELVSSTPRLLASDLRLGRPFGDDWDTYARIQRWQVLQTPEVESRIEAPFERVPQIGARYTRRLASRFDVGFEGEFNRFTNPSDATTSARSGGNRVHLLGRVSMPFASPGWTFTPKLAFNAASYSLDQVIAGGPTNASRVIPTWSVDSAWVFERDATFLGRTMRQTLEPHLLYVNTPFRDQSQLPNFDSSAKDFNFDSIFTENAFTGVDRVSDAHQITAGVTTRLLDPQTGAETMRLGLAQRYLLRDQFVTPNADTPFSGVGEPLTRRFSDILLLGSTNLVRNWALDASLQYSPDTKSLARSVIGARYSPGPYRTVSATYRLTQGLSEQVEIGWQWPIYGPTPQGAGTSPRSSSAAGTGSSCEGSWYSVGRINYSTLERRLIDSVVGLEYDAGCWIGRVVATRLSTGRSEATTRLAVQLELVGLSRLNLGSNPLQVLKDNIPGFRLLRDDRTKGSTLNTYD